MQGFKNAAIKALYTNITAHYRKI